MAIIFGAGGAYLFFAKPKEIPTTKDLSAAIPKPIPANVTGAIGVLQRFFKERCSTSSEDLENFGGAGIMDIGGEKGMIPRAVIWPENTEEVEIILNIANEYNVPVIPYSGGTSLEG
jgi:D-lactate dehydrogenase (cytochrome)